MFKKYIILRMEVILPNKKSLEDQNNAEEP
jgi:hypothetical protein